MHEEHVESFSFSPARHYDNEITLVVNALRKRGLMSHIMRDV